MPHLKKEYAVKSGDFVHAGEGSMQIQSTLKTIGYDPEIIRRASICAYESEMNIVMHGGDGNIYLNVDDRLIIIEASDDGVGIEAGHGEDIFGPFKRKGDPKSIQGLGLGLAIVKELAEQHAGRAWMDNSYRRGAKICFSISKSLGAVTS